MKTYKFVPDCCQGDDASFEGHVIIKKPNYDERCEMWEQVGDLTHENNIEQMKKMRVAVGLSKAFYVEVDLKHKETGEEFKSFDDMHAESELHEVLTDVALKLLHRFKLGNG
jgi:hypothetical protein